MHWQTTEAAWCDDETNPLLMVKYIDEPAVLAELCAAREDLRGAEGFVVTAGPRYLGHVLFFTGGRGEPDVTTVLETSINGAAEPEALDLAVRACVSSGWRRGCGQYAVNMADAVLARWWRDASGGEAAPRPVSRLLGCGCGGAER